MRTAQTPIRETGVSSREDLSGVEQKENRDRAMSVREFRCCQLGLGIYAFRVVLRGGLGTEVEAGTVLYEVSSVNQNT